ncbi:putative methyltransferase ICS2 [Silene latifolia]|uniref:putative methyltransferase ICS2 n=1 Tax=Silene latifolia TaxID=37657 RepID=UPI003D7872A0
MLGMETKEILHMTKGDGEFSYASNTTTHKRFTDTMKPILEKAIRPLMLAEVVRPGNVLRVADLGCGVGPSPITFISTIQEIVDKIYKQRDLGDYQVMPEIQIFMSDLPSNDFNLLFKDVGKLQEGGQKEEDDDNKPLLFVMGAPGSFYERLFPSNTLHLVHSYYAIHWLSQVPRGLCDKVGEPMNKGKIVASDTSEPQVLKAYYAQFKQDFTKFLKCRSREVVHNGYMVLATICRPSMQPFEPRSMKYLSQALACLVSKGIIKEEKLDSFDLPVYHACKEEIQEIVSEEGSFAIEHLDVVISKVQNEINDVRLKAESLAKITRSYSEALIADHFGAQVWNDLYNVLYHIILEDFKLDAGPSDIFNIVIFLRKMID